MSGDNKVIGYKVQSSEQVQLINDFKKMEMGVVDVIEQFFEEGAPSVDKEWMSIGLVDIRKGFMSVVRAIARPKGD